MNMPGFTAEDSLGPTIGIYCGSASFENCVSEASVAPTGLWDVVNFVKELPGAVAETFASGEAFQSFMQGMAGAAQTLSGGYLGDPEALAQELEALGYQRPEARVESFSVATGKYVIGPAIGAATFVRAWTYFGGPTYHVAFRGASQPPFGHFIYGAEGSWVHAMGPWFRMTVSAARAPPASWIVFKDIPVLFPTAVTTTGGTAWTCVTAAISGFVRGWLGG